MGEKIPRPLMVLVRGITDCPKWTESTETRRWPSWKLQTIASFSFSPVPSSLLDVIQAFTSRQRRWTGGSVPRCSEVCEGKARYKAVSSEQKASGRRCLSLWAGQVHRGTVQSTTTASEDTPPTPPTHTHTHTASP